MESDTKAKHISKANRRLVDLMLFGLNHGVEKIRIKGTGTIVPFIVTESHGEKEVLKLFTEDPEAGLGEGIRLIKAEKKSQFVVLVYSGFLPFKDKTLNAIIVKGYDRNDAVGYTCAQRYCPQKFLSWFKLIGDRAYLGNTEQLLAK
jgi:hypothetical protein